MNSYDNIDQYIANFPPDVTEKLQEIRKTVHRHVPEAKEKISYGIPTFTFHSNLVHFAGYENHVGFYPGAYPIAALADELTAYKTSKGTVQFPLDKPLPMELIKKMTLLAVERNLERKRNEFSGRYR